MTKEVGNMPVHDDLGLRMKSYYEQISKTKLMRRTPVIIRIDGKAFHTFTRGFAKPFDMVLMKSMQETTKYLCESIQGCVLGYTQSDEITLLLIDYYKFETSAWFDYEVQKMCSIAASMATMAFNKLFKNNVDAYIRDNETGELVEIYTKAVNKGAMFDARVFNIPKEEVTNCIYWRQLDASRNSVQMVGQAYFSHKQLQNKSCSNIQDMLMEDYNINWNDFTVPQKRGTAVIKVTKELATEEGDQPQLRSEWMIDENIPIFKGEGREYIEKLIMVGE